MTVKSIATGVAAVAAIGAAAAGVTAMTSTIHPAASQVQPVVFDAPLPMDQTTAVPTAEQLTSVLSTLANPNVPFQSKGNLVEGGVGPGEGAMADHALKKAAKKGELPLSFSVTNIAPAGPGAATADVTVSGPKLAPTMMNTTFVDQGGWALSHDSAMALLQAASAA